jgi:hypothetical protein
MSDQIVDFGGLHWAVWSRKGAENAIHLGSRYPDSPDEDTTYFIFDRANATRLAIALATALAGKPVPPIEEVDGQLELPFPDPPWSR